MEGRFVQSHNLVDPDVCSRRENKIKITSRRSFRGYVARPVLSDF